LINSGANVPDVASFLREFDLCRVTVCLRVNGDDCEIDAEFRKWLFASSNFEGDVTMADFGRGLLVCGADGKGDGVERPKGLARFGEPFN
jgi:hypothetical protein